MQILNITNRDAKESLPDGSAVHHVSWKDLPGVGNLANYDVLILNLGTLGVDARTRSKDVTWKSLASVLNGESLADLLFSKCSIYVVGDPRTQILEEDVEIRIKQLQTQRASSFGNSSLHRFHNEIEGLKNGEKGYTCLLAGLGLEAILDNRNVFLNRISWEASDEDGIVKYLKRIKSNVPYTLRTVLHKGAFKHHQEINLIAECGGVDVRLVGKTNYNTCLSMVEDYTYGNIGPLNLYGSGQSRSSGKSGNDYKKTTRMVFLPSSGHSAADDSLLVIECILGVAGSTSEPVWVSKLIVPNEMPLKMALKDLSDEQDALQIRKGELMGKIKDERKIVGLLFSDGDNLDQAVEKALKNLGATFLPSPSERQDKIIQVNVNGGQRLAVVEIKGTHKQQFSIDCLRELADWVADAKHRLKCETVKGIFVGNNLRSQEPEQRPPLFNENCMEAAHRHGLAVLSTFQLFQAVTSAQRDEIDVSRFWAGLFNTVGFVAQTDNPEPNAKVPTPSAS